MDTATGRERLTDMRAELQDSIRVLRDEHAEESSELTGVDQHPADTADLVSEADRENAGIEELERQLAEVEAALGRLDDGTWGVCQVDGEAIHDERLEVRPEARYCVRHQEEAEARST